MESNSNTGTSRRAFLTAAGAGGIAGLSGCVSFGEGGSESGGSGGSGGGSGTESGTTTGEAGPETVVFGQPGALTGSFDFLQPGVSQAADAAVRHINEAGGPLGAELELVRRDTGVDPQ
ncbi:ABC transporter substrate-binding protein, partial [Haloparvum sedimenti]|uniref:ABC transporter substrate-binding protein n=1 Tax=Haloparvum sedimenti TaxID=1678448 RepID=UPI001FDF2DE9